MRNPVGLFAAIAAAVCMTACSMRPPLTPGAPDGPGQAYPNTPCYFTATTTDPNNLSVAYRFSWGDFEMSEWSDFVPGGVPVTMAHQWLEPRPYEVRVQAKNVVGLETPWSKAHVMSVVARASFPDVIIGTVPVGGDPVDAAVLPNGGFMYVANERVDYVTVVRLADRRVVKRIWCGSSPRFVTSSPGGAYVYVSNWNSGDVTVIDTRDYSVIGTFAAGVHPGRPVFPANGSHCYVPCEGEGTLRLADLNSTFAMSIEVGTAPVSAACLPNGRFVYVADATEQMLVIVDCQINEVAQRIFLGFKPNHVTCSADGKYVYASEAGGSRVAVVATVDPMLVRHIEVGKAPGGMTSLTTGDYVYVPISERNEVVVIRTEDNVVAGRVTVMDGPCSVATSSWACCVVTVNRRSETVSILGYD